MKYISELKPAAAQPRPNTRLITNAMPLRSQTARRNEPSGFPHPQARKAQNAQRNYERSSELFRGWTISSNPLWFAIPPIPLYGAHNCQIWRSGLFFARAAR